MSNKNIKLLLVLFVALLGFLGLKQYAPLLSQETSAYTQKTKEVSVQAIAAIKISNSSGSVQLTKEGDVWKVAGKKADATKVNNLLSSLLPTTAPELIAQTDKRHKELELTDDLATKIKLDNKLTVLTGKYSGSGVYARFDTDPAVYLLKNNPSVTTTAAEWYDKTILSFDQSKATKMTFLESSSTITLIKKDNKWVNEKDSKEAKTDKVSSLLSSVSSLSAQSLFEDTKSAVYPKTPALTFSIDHDGKSETLVFYKGASDYLVKRQSDSGQFIVSEYSVSSVISAPKDIL